MYAINANKCFFFFSIFVFRWCVYYNDIDILMSTCELALPPSSLAPPPMRQRRRRSEVKKYIKGMNYRFVKFYLISFHRLFNLVCFVFFHSLNICNRLQECVSQYAMHMKMNESREQCQLLMWPFAFKLLYLRSQDNKNIHPKTICLFLFPDSSLTLSLAHSNHSSELKIKSERKNTQRKKMGNGFFFFALWGENSVGWWSMHMYLIRMRCARTRDSARIM